MSKYFILLTVLLFTVGCNSMAEAQHNMNGTPMMEHNMDHMATPMMEHNMEAMPAATPMMDHSMHAMTSTTEHNMNSMGSMTSTMMGGGHHMQPITASNVAVATETKGGQPLAFQMVDGVKVFSLTTKTVQWQILDGVMITAYTYNGTLPGPMIRVTQGDKIRVVVKNELDVPTTVHWHGVTVPNNMDGVPGMTQAPIQPGETFNYEFEVKDVGTFWYHSHFESDRQVGAGLFGAFIADPKTETNKPDVDMTLMLSEVMVQNGQTFAAMPMMGMEPNYFLINGKSFPNTENITIKKGQRVRLRFIAAGQFIHPMHLHGMPFKVVATDGHPIPEVAQLTKDTIAVAPGERYDVEFVATELGDWMIHCHILHHTTNNGADDGGLMMMIKVIN